MMPAEDRTWQVGGRPWGGGSGLRGRQAAEGAKPAMLTPTDPFGACRPCRACARLLGTATRALPSPRKAAPRPPPKHNTPPHPPQVFVYGVNGVQPPTEKKALLAYLAGLPDSEAYEALRRAELLAPLAKYGGAYNIQRAYDKARGGGRGQGGVPTTSSACTARQGAGLGGLGAGRPWAWQGCRPARWQRGSGYQAQGLRLTLQLVSQRGQLISSLLPWLDHAGGAACGAVGARRCCAGTQPGERAMLRMLCPQRVGIRLHASRMHFGKGKRRDAASRPGGPGPAGAEPGGGPSFFGHARAMASRATSACSPASSPGSALHPGAPAPRRNPNRAAGSAQLSTPSPAPCRLPACRSTGRA